MMLKKVSLCVMLGLFSSQVMALCANENKKFERLMSMSLDELMHVEIEDLGSLTKTAFKYTPATINRITEKDISRTNARTLSELLEIHIPNLQVIRHHWEAPHIGVRGITSDREDKLMIRVNGRVMNQRSHIGAMTERFLPILKDIKHIDVVRGAGSSLHGLGAVSLVVDIHTHTAKTYEGYSLNVSGGFGHELYAVEGHASKGFDDKACLYIYTGIADVKGANNQDAPLVFGRDAVTLSGETINKGAAYPTISFDGRPYPDEPVLKLHAQLSTDNSESWIRYTQSGSTAPTEVFFINDSVFDIGIDNEEVLETAYKQLTAFYEYNYKVNDAISINSVLSFDDTDFTRIRPINAREEVHNEKEWFAKFIVAFATTEQSEVSIGAAYSSEKFDVAAAESPELSDPWRTYTASLLGEWQWRPAPQWTSFIGGRIDKNSYTKALLSPRASIVWSPNEKDFLKLLLTRSQRMNFAEETRQEYLADNQDSIPEVSNNVELIYEKILDNIYYSTSVFYIDLDAVGWDVNEAKSTLVGNQKQWGVELEVAIEAGGFDVQLSHAYTKLIDFDLLVDDVLTTAEPFGFGDDIADWSNHITKINANYSFDERLAFNSSLRYFWGFPGSQDYKDRYVSQGSPLVDADWDKGFDKQIFLNAGLSYQINLRSSVNFNAYNLLGLIDKDLNKRNFRDSKGDFRSEAVALKFDANFKF